MTDGAGLTGIYSRNAGGGRVRVRRGNCEEARARHSARLSLALALSASLESQRDAPIIYAAPIRRQHLLPVYSTCCPPTRSGRPRRMGERASHAGPRRPLHLLVPVGYTPERALMC